MTKRKFVVFFLLSGPLTGRIFGIMVALPQGTGLCFWI